MAVAVVGGGAPKSTSSRDAMNHCQETSPLYDGWLSSVDGDIQTALAAIRAGDLEALGSVAEASALAMHASMWAARPAIVYWQPPTLALLAEVRAMRADGLSAWATIDAGPHVKVLCNKRDVDAVTQRVATIEGVTSVLQSEAGGPAELVDEN